MKPLLQLLRLPAGFSAFSNIIAAHVLVTGAHVQWGVLLVTILASVCLYFSGMVLNDCFDYAEDARERPNRPLPSGRVPLRIAWWLGAGLMCAGLIMSATLGMRSLLVAVVLAALIVAYDCKKLPQFPASLTMGACRYANWCLGLSVVPFSLTTLVLPLPLFLYVTGLTLLSDAETGQASKRLLYQALACIAASMVALLVISIWQTANVLSLMWVLIVCGYVVQVLQPVLHDFSKDNVQQAVGRLVMGVMLLDALLLAVFGHFVWAVCIVFALLLGKWIGRWLYVS